MIVPFKYYLHDNYSSSEFQEVVLENQLGLDETLTKRELDELMENIGRPFYEVRFECTLDTETGDVQIISTHL